MEIGKETLKKMMLCLTPEGWVNSRNKIVHIGHGNNEKVAEVSKERIKNGVERTRRGKAIAPMAPSRPSAPRPRPKRSSSQGEPIYRPTQKDEPSNFEFLKAITSVHNKVNLLSKYLVC